MGSCSGFWSLTAGPGKRASFSGPVFPLPTFSIYLLVPLVNDVMRDTLAEPTCIGQGTVITACLSCLTTGGPDK